MESLGTPTTPVPQEKYAPFIYRWAALNLDQFLFALVMIVIAIFTGTLNQEEVGNNLGNVFSLLYVVYSVYFIKTKQATLGKQFFKLKVKVEDGAQVGWGRAIIRESVGKLISYFVFCLGFVWSLWDKKKQTWHDKMVGTVVVQTEELSSGRKFLAYLFAFGLVLIAILGIIVTIVLIALNPSKQIQKAQEKAQQTQQMYENQQLTPSP